MYAPRKSVSGTYTSNGKVELSGYEMEYTEQKTHNGCALAMFLLPAIAIVTFIISQLG